MMLAPAARAASTVSPAKTSHRQLAGAGRDEISRQVSSIRAARSASAEQRRLARMRADADDKFVA